MTKFLNFGFFLTLLIGLGSCSKDAPASTDERNDRGHENPSKVEFISTEMTKNGDVYTKTNNTQKITYSINGIQGLISEGTAFQWKKEMDYLLEIVYYNSKNERMNNEFVTPEMAQIHQHFFRMEGKTATEMNEYLEYTYQDTNPENGYLGEAGVRLLKRSWDKQNPTENDPIGLKGIFHVKKGGIDFNLHVALVHFMGADRGFTKLRNGQMHLYNILPNVSFFSSDIGIIAPIQILN